MAQTTAQSERAGRGIWSLGRSELRCQLYQALTTLTCAGCGQPITRGETFIRRGMGGHGTRTFPFCHRCEQFRPLRRG